MQLDRGIKGATARRQAALTGGSLAVHAAALGAMVLLGPTPTGGDGRVQAVAVTLVDAGPPGRAVNPAAASSRAATLDELLDAMGGASASSRKRSTTASDLDGLLGVGAEAAGGQAAMTAGAHGGAGGVDPFASPSVYRKDAKTEQDLWPQLARCWRPESRPAELTLKLTVDAAGRLIRSPVVDSLPALRADPQRVRAAAIAAARACAPYFIAEPYATEMTFRVRVRG